MTVFFIIWLRKYLILPEHSLFLYWKYNSLFPHYIFIFKLAHFPLIHYSTGHVTFAHQLSRTFIILVLILLSWIFYDSIMNDLSSQTRRALAWLILLGLPNQHAAIKWTKRSLFQNVRISDKVMMLCKYPLAFLRPWKCEKRNRRRRSFYLRLPKSVGFPFMKT